MAKKYVSISFRTTDQFSDHLGRKVIEMDKSASEIIRACICLALPQLESNPSLFKILDQDGICSQSD